MSFSLLPAERFVCRNARKGKAVFLTILQRELLANLIAFRFSVAVIICLMLVVANTFVLIEDYEDRLASYNTAAQKNWEKAKTAETYSYLKINVDRPPNPLSIFNQGLDQRLGNTIRTHHGFVPFLWDTQSHSAANPFLNLFSNIDLSFIFQVVLSLLAMLFAYDAIAAEREGGTLRLIMTNPLSRGVILLAKYLSAMICLILPLIISLLLSLSLSTESGMISFDGDDWSRIGGMTFTSIIYLSAFYLIGLLISTTARRTATALMLSMFVWVFLVLIYPSLSAFTINQLIDIEEPLEASYREIEQIWERFEKEKQDYLKKDSVEGESTRFNMKGNNNLSYPSFTSLTTLQYMKLESSNWWSLSKESESQIPYVKAYYQFIEPLRIRTAERAGLARQKAIEQTYIRKEKAAQWVMRFSPATMYDLATEAWASTDLRGIEDFIKAVHQYRQSLIDHFYNKDAFASRQWFASDKGKVSWDDLPRFSYRRVNVWTSAKNALPDLMLLLLLNVVLFMVTFLIFVRQEI